MRAQQIDQWGPDEQITLPDKPSELIELALHDLQLCERSSGYEIDMQTWHTPLKNRCWVCLAGSVIAKTFKAPKHINVEVYGYGGTGGKLKALDNFAYGYIWAALHYLELDKPDGLPEYEDIIDYEVDRKQWKLGMRKIIRMLKKHEL